ncbi:signal peptidase II [Propionimicrobium sp. PCR01-08-3]|uniref:signal peptidase II n=1 Tax=Propionimicrobium sp. PCR01-08-3 TaxID=3052086 RepID=UPI00255D1100|nr:signal peptidase II [Propionimicrobium sp. PCR01-08-3]WIY81638.1 signal peptidase II [Propionimicrobium sp. PCR01-08-3]
MQVIRLGTGATSTAPAPGKFRIVMAALVIVLYALDRFTKHLVLNKLTLGQPIEVIPGFLSWALHFNPGAAFSMGTEFTVVLSVLALGVLIALLIFVAPRVRSWLAAVAVGWLIAGVAGNLTDRLVRDPGPFLGHVVDFIAVRGFAIFNVADMCITGAAILLIIWSFRSERR